MRQRSARFHLHRDLVHEVDKASKTEGCCHVAARLWKWVGSRQPVVQEVVEQIEFCVILIGAVV